MTASAWELIRRVSVSDTCHDAVNLVADQLTSLKLRATKLHREAAAFRSTCSEQDRADADAYLQRQSEIKFARDGVV